MLLLQKQTCYRSKGKDKFVPVHALKAFAGAEVEPHLFLTWALDAGEW